MLAELHHPSQLVMVRYSFANNSAFIDAIAEEVFVGKIVHVPVLCALQKTQTQLSKKKPQKMVPDYFMVCIY